MYHMQEKSQQKCIFTNGDNFKEVYGISACSGYARTMLTQCPQAKEAARHMKVSI